MALAWILSFLIQINRKSLFRDFLVKLHQANSV